jgi:hypothetical protein
VVKYSQMMDSTWIDGALYPDAEPPAALDSLAEQVDFAVSLHS